MSSLCCADRDSRMSTRPSGRTCKSCSRERQRARWARRRLASRFTLSRFILSRFTPKPHLPSRRRPKGRALGAARSQLSSSSSSSSRRRLCPSCTWEEAAEEAATTPTRPAGRPCLHSCLHSCRFTAVGWHPLAWPMAYHLPLGVAGQRVAGQRMFGQGTVAALCSYPKHHRRHHRMHHRTHHRMHRQRPGRAGCSPGSIPSQRWSSTHRRSTRQSPNSRSMGSRARRRWVTAAGGQRRVTSGRPSTRRHCS